VSTEYEKKGNGNSRPQIIRVNPSLAWGWEIGKKRDVAKALDEWDPDTVAEKCRY